MHGSDEGCNPLLSPGDSGMLAFTRDSECFYGSFYSATPSPEGADTSKATADFRNGVLEVMVPTSCKPAAKAQRVEIKEDK